MTVLVTAAGPGASADRTPQSLRASSLVVSSFVIAKSEEMPRKKVPKDHDSLDICHQYANAFNKHTD